MMKTTPLTKDENADTESTTDDDDSEDGDVFVPAVDTDDTDPELRSAENEGATIHEQPRSDGRINRSTQARQRVDYVPGFDGKSYETQFLGVTAKKQAEWSDKCYRIAVNVMFTQMTAAKGIKLFGERAIAAMFKEYNQLNDMGVFGIVNPDSLSVEQKKKALRAINLIKEKRCGRIKGRTVADGRPQRSYIP